MQGIRRLWQRFYGWVTGDLCNLLALVFSLLLIVFTACSMLLTIHCYVQTSEINILRATEETLHVYAEFWDDYQEQLKNRSLEIRSNAEIMALLMRRRTLMENEQRVLHSYLNYLSLSRNDLAEIEVYFVQTGYLYRYKSNSNRSYEPAPNYETQPWYPHISKANRWMYLETTRDERTGKTYLLYHRAIIDIPTQQPLVIMTYRIDSHILSTMFSAESGHLLFNESDRSLFYGGLPSVDAVDLDSVGSQALSGDRYQSFSLNGTPYQMVCVHTGDWCLVQIIPMQVFRASINQSIRSIFLLGLVFLLIQIVVVIVTVHSFTRPLREFTERIDQIDSNTRQSVEIHTHYREILRLTHKFNQLLQRIEDLYKAEYSAKLAEKTMRYKAMESQINSHFLYNTLQAVSTKALQNNDTEIYTMVNLLSRNFRYAIQQGEYVSLKEELIFSENYVKLQCLRFGDRLVVTFDVEAQILNSLVPKFMVQIPIENAILHALDTMTGEVLHIQVTGKRQNTHIVISILDDGPGIAENKLREVRARMENGITEENSDYGLGLVNLYSRLNFIYGAPGTIQLESAPKKGFCVIIRLPDDNWKGAI